MKNELVIIEVENLHDKKDEYWNFENDPRFRSECPNIQKQLNYFIGKRKHKYNEEFYSYHHNPINGTPCCGDMYVPHNNPVVYYSRYDTTLKFWCFSCEKKYSENDLKK